jgi:hypothetical protein
MHMQSCGPHVGYPHWGSICGHRTLFQGRFLILLSPTFSGNPLSSLLLVLEPANSGMHALGSNMGDPWLVGAVVFVGCAMAGTLWHLGGTTHFQVEGQG